MNTVAAHIIDTFPTDAPDDVRIRRARLYRAEFRGCTDGTTNNLLPGRGTSSRAAGANKNPAPRSDFLHSALAQWRETDGSPAADLFPESIHARIPRVLGLMVFLVVLSCSTTVPCTATARGRTAGR